MTGTRKGVSGGPVVRGAPSGYVVPVGARSDSSTTAIGAEIAAARRARGMSQQDLAEQLGVERKAISRWENGHTSNIGANLAKLGAALGWSDEKLAAVVRGAAPPVEADESRIIPYDPDDTTLPGLHLPPGYPTWKIPHPLAGLILLLDDERLTPPKRRRVLLMLEEMRLMIGAMLNVEDKTPDEVVDETFAAISEAQRREPAMREKPAGAPGQQQAGRR